MSYLGARVEVPCPRCATELGEVVATTEGDPGHVHVECMGCDYVFEVRL